MNLFKVNVNQTKEKILKFLLFVFQKLLRKNDRNR